MLQKPSKKSKAKDHAKYLTSRLDKWSKGELDLLMEECQEIQARIIKSKKQKEETKKKAFVRHMLNGKLKQACNCINNNDSITGVHKLTDEIKMTLNEKHPKAEAMESDALLPITRPTPNPVIFEQITAELVQRCSKNLNGSGGPTLVDTDSWKHFLCSKSYGRHPFHLAEAICGLAKRICTENIHPDCLEEFVAGRLIPLDKNPGVRPIGIGETLRRIVGKAVTTILKSDIQAACGCLQTCTGIRSGIEAAIHATHEA